MKYVTFSLLEMEKLLHREVMGSDVTSNVVLYCLISVIIDGYALLLNVVPWEQLRDGNEYVLIGRENHVKCLGGHRCVDRGSRGDCGPVVWRAVEMQSAFLKEVLCGNRKAVGVLICLLKQCTHEYVRVCQQT